MKSLVVSLSLLLVLGYAGLGTCQNEMIAAWSFEGGNPDMIKDVTGNGYNGVGQEIVFVDGKMGQGVEFDGTNSVVEVPTDDALNIEGAITVEAWTKPSGFNDLSAVAQKWGDNTGRRQYLLCFVGSNVRFYISGSGDTWPAAASAGTVEIGEWTHLAGTYDGEVIRVYINGQLDGETPNNEGLFASDVPVWIGGYGPNDDFGSNRHYPGVVDEVRFWAGALSEAEINTSMNQQAAAIAPKGKLGTLWGSLKKFVQ